MKKNAVATFVALICVLMVASCEYKPKVVEIAGSDGFATFTQKVDGRELLGVQDAAGNALTEATFVRVEYEKGYMVTIIDGAFDGIIGVVDEVDTDNNMVRVIISMLGRETPIELELDQVEAMNK